tara:strand:+ start:113 stop:2113 length:2001 start_codon:yes stop_codon:yes gene_type:complete
MVIFRRLIKFLIITIFSIFSLIFLLFFIDATSFDRHYVNRGKLETSHIHLNSRHSYRFANFLKNNYLYFQELFFNESYKKRWSVEKNEDRLKFPEQKILKAKNDNFSKQLYSLEEYIDSKKWFRSHGNYFSTRFSNLIQVNSNNANKLKLAWIYETNTDSKMQKENQANAIFDSKHVYIPDVDNKIVALNGETGKKIWEHQVQEGIAGKRGLLLWKKNENDTSGKIFFTDNRKYLFSINSLNGMPIKSFGDNGKVKVGLTPLPPIIYKNEIILVTTDNVIKSFDLNSGKINWKYKVNKTKNNIIYPDFKKGSPWGGLSLDIKRGLLFFTTGNPEPWYVGITREGDNLFANSIVAFDLEEKKIKWHFQEIPHDVWNSDLAAPPILTMIRRENKLVDVVVVMSKTGNVFILDRESGETLFDIIYERAPISNVPGERTSPYQINIELPQQICRGRFKKDYLTDFDSEVKEEFEKEIEDYNFGFPTPPLLGKKTISIGACVRWAGGSIDTKNNILFVTSDNSVTLINLVKDNENKFSYYHEWDTLVDSDGYPAMKPPWGAITALNLNNGKIIWQKPFGEIEELKEKNIFNTGSTNRAGLTASSGNVIFASGTEDNMFRVYNSSSGEELWSYKMESAGSAPPTIYEVNNKQYILVPAYEKTGNKVYCFTLR